MRYLLLAILTCSVISHVLMAKPSTLQSLGDLHWQHRLIIITVNSEKQWHQLKQNVQYHGQDIEARKLLFLVNKERQTHVLSASGQYIPSPSLNSELAALSKLHPNKVLLIGLDGGIKKQYESRSFDLQKAFAEIDLMPMRRWEIE